MANSKNIDKGVILAAGRGMRAYPDTKYIPKVLFRVGLKSLIEWNIELLRDQMGVKEVIIIIGYRGDDILNHLDGKDYGVRISYIRQPKQKGIAHALLMAEASLKGNLFCVVLGDEFYYPADHRKMASLLEQPGSEGVLAFREESDKRKIARNYTAELTDGQRISKLTEKPSRPQTNLMGLGTYLLNDKVFYYLRNTPPSDLRGEVEITDALSGMARNEDLYACRLECNYFNITNRHDLNQANYLYRHQNFGQWTVDVIIPAYNEEETLAAVIRDYKQCKGVDRVLVIDNNSCDRTAEIASQEGAVLISESKQGYGNALRRGLDESAADIMVLTEADGSFHAKDVDKLLVYLKDADMAIGTRTTRQLIEQGANMGGITRWANVAMGKLAEALWWGQEPRYTDVGCTYRAIWKSSYNQVRHLLKSNGPEFSVEMMLALMKARLRVIEVPVSYHPRAGGDSKHSVSFRAKAKTAWRMFKIILKYRFGLNR